ncbi:MAG TPA: GNAT family N-acetyltransferase [Candidatus Fimivicinus intestinavium]|nr:GNAT family N-acetyltransferase [Candidatus Fimivicinus intestinavium]
MAAVRKAEQRDLDFLLTYDRHIAPQELQSVVAMGRMLVLEAESGIIGWLRWNLFWDNTPFMTMLYLLEGARGQGHGRRLVSQWEALMKAQGYSLVMTSTQSDETAQHFYRKLCYVDSGALLLPEEPLEIIFTKKLLSF